MKQLSTSLADFTYENNILIVCPVEGLFLDAPEMEAMLKEAVTFTGGEKYYALIDMTRHIDSTAEARNYYAVSEYSKFRYADALVIESLATRLVTNFYLSINKPSVPSKMFTDKQDAINWLQEQKRNNDSKKTKQAVLLTV